MAERSEFGISVVQGSATCTSDFGRRGRRSRLQRPRGVRLHISRHVIITAVRGCEKPFAGAVTKVSCMAVIEGEGGGKKGSYRGVVEGGVKLAEFPPPTPAHAAYSEARAKTDNQMCSLCGRCVIMIERIGLVAESR